MIIKEEDKRKFSAKMLEQYGVKIFDDDVMFPILYMMVQNTEEQKEVIKELKNTLSKGNGNAVVLNNAEAAEAYMKEKRKGKKNVIEYSIAAGVLLMVFFFLAWYFLSIKEKHEYNKRMEKPSIISKDTSNVK